MNARFFISPPISGATATLAGQEAHHLLHVMRAQVGEEVTLFDGRGVEFTGQITRCSRRDVELAIISRVEVDRESARPLSLAVAMPKGDRQRMLVEKCVELGVQRLVPLETERSVVGLKPPAIEKLRRVVVEASKQCGRNRLMEIDPPMALADWWHSQASLAFRGIAVPTAPDRLGPTTFKGAESLAVAIGPEGGWTDAEFEAAASAGWHAFHLGPRILRIETAAIAVAAMSELHDSGGLVGQVAR